MSPLIDQPGLILFTVVSVVLVVYLFWAMLRPERV